MIVVPIGLQCGTALFKKHYYNKIEEHSSTCKSTLPFDWMFATPKFVYEMLDMLLNKEIEIKYLVENYFFYCEKKARIISFEHYITDNNGTALYNEKYNVIFPHEYTGSFEENVNKYTRRFQRLKDLILNTKEKLCFIYISQSSQEYGNFTIDGKQVVCDVYYHLSKIYDLIGKFNKNYEIKVFDSLQNENKDLLDKNIFLYNISSWNTFDDLIRQVDNII